jgi:arginase
LYNCFAHLTITAYDSDSHNPFQSSCLFMSKETAMPTFTVIDAPSNLGLRPTGVETLPVALKAAGLLNKLHATYAGHVPPLPYNVERDPLTKLRNVDGIRIYAQHLADAVSIQVQAGRFPIVLGGDCSILLGAMLALQRIGHYGLFFLDGHADFYQPEAELHGEVASMDLALLSGRGPDILANIEGFRPLVHDQAIVAFGFRDADQALQEGSQDIRLTHIHTYDLHQARTPDVVTAATRALEPLQRRELSGFWIHLDADVLHDEIMPAVDYRIPNGLQFDELSAVLRILIGSGQAVGMTITIFNPLLDTDGTLAQRFVDCIVAGLGGAERS